MFSLKPATSKIYPRKVQFTCKYCKTFTIKTLNFLMQCSPDIKGLYTFSFSDFFKKKEAKLLKVIIFAVDLLLDGWIYVIFFLIPTFLCKCVCQFASYISLDCFGSVVYPKSDCLP